MRPPLIKRLKKYLRPPAGCSSSWLDSIEKIRSGAEPPEIAVQFATYTEWREWLEENHTRNEGVWLTSHKKATGKPRFEYEEAVEEALRFGWIDSIPN